MTYRPQPRPTVRRVTATALALLILAVPLQATWSIVIINERTGEVAVASATCLTNRDLAQLVPVMLVGVGGAAAQSSIDSNGANRQLIRAEMLAGTHPKDILVLLKNSDNNHQSRQYGLADLQEQRRTFTGRNCAPWAGGVVGRDGPFLYSIQGNILVDENVVGDCEQALISTSGDMAEKLMAAMEAAAAAGGDSRCTNAGKSADIGFMMISRMGDVDGNCNSSVGCANGDYYMRLNVKDQARSAPDPVIQLRDMFDLWRQTWRGRPDHNLCTKTWTDESIPGNGTTKSTLELRMVDWEGFDLGHGGATVSVDHAADSAGLSTIGPVVDLGDGRYTVELTAGAGQGIDELEVLVDDGMGEIQLWRNPRLVLGETLIASATDLSASVGGTVSLDLVGPEDPSGRDYLLLATTSGIGPGFAIGGIQFPLNYDLFMLISYRQRNGSVFVDTQRTLAANGTASAQFSAPAGALTPLVGGEISFAYMTLNPIDFPSSPVSILIVP